MACASQQSAEDRDHFKSACAAFFNYQVDAMTDIARLERSLSSVSSAHTHQLRVSFHSRIEQLRSAIYGNYGFLSRCVHGNKSLFPSKTLPNGSHVIPNLMIEPKDVQSVRAALKQCVRDWSSAGAAERQESYAQVIDEVQRNFPSPRYPNGLKVKVLTPGAGLGRLSFEIARLGYSSQGNEQSYFLLLASDFLLNRTKRTHELTLCPYIHDLTNTHQFQDTVRTVTLPDRCPAQELTWEDDFSMVAGDFVGVYSAHPCEWDCVVTCFCIDKAVNILKYIETIWRTLKPGGIWVNFGPLRYQAGEKSTDLAINLTWEDVRYAILATGFQITREEMRESRYSQDPKSMMQVTYQCSFTTAVKKT